MICSDLATVSKYFREQELGVSNLDIVRTLCANCQSYETCAAATEDEVEWRQAKS
jgi:hypothetical protein